MKDLLCRFFPVLSRRDMLRASGLGLGSLALTYLLHAEESGRTDGQPRTGHFPAQANAVIMLVQNGGPSQMELFDPKPELNKRAGQTHSVTVETFQKGSEANKLLGCPFKFQRRGQCGMEMSEILPHLGSVAEDLCLVRSMHSEH